MLMLSKSHKGFTIVELLIVIVVIAILAAVSVVAYTGIQNRANDSVVQNDLSNMAKKLQLAAAETGEFPRGGATRASSEGSATGDSTNFPNFSFAVSKSAYSITVNNLFYCTGVETSSGENIFRIGARSKSGNSYMYQSGSGLTSLGNVAVTQTTTCQGIDYPYTYSYGYNSTTQNMGWKGWTNG